MGESQICDLLNEWITYLIWKVQRDIKEISNTDVGRFFQKVYIFYLTILFFNSDCVVFILPTIIGSSTSWITSIIGHCHQILKAQDISRAFRLIHINPLRPMQCRCPLGQQQGLRSQCGGRRGK